MTDKPYITQTELKEKLHYDPETGAFTWKSQQRGTVLLSSPNGCPVGSINNGRLVIGLRNRTYTAARLAWLYVYGTLPQGSVYPKDDDPMNVAIANLYAAGGSSGPRKPRVVDTSVIWFKGQCKIRGVTKVRGNWVARPSINKKRVYLGQFATQKAAEQAVRHAIKEAGTSA